MRDLTLNGGMTYADTKYREQSGRQRIGKPLDPALFQLPGRQHFERAEVDGHRLGRLDAADRRHRDLRGLVLCRCRYISRRTTPAPTCSPRSSRTASRRQRAASACAGRTTAGRSSSGRRTCSTRTIEQVAFNTPFQGSGTTARWRRSVASARRRRPSPTQLYGAFLGEPRTFGMTLRARWTRLRGRGAGLCAASAAAAGDSDLPGRQRDRRRGACRLRHPRRLRQPPPAASAAQASFHG